MLPVKGGTQGEGRAAFGHRGGSGRVVREYRGHGEVEREPRALVDVSGAIGGPRRVHQRGYFLGWWCCGARPRVLITNGEVVLLVVARGSSCCGVPAWWE